ncbi:MAG: helix-turn-helix domain-containing protein [Pseudomonadota bacterium]
MVRPNIDGDELTSRERATLPDSLKLALAWLNQRLDEPIKLEQLATVAGVRPRTIEVHFKTHLGVTPLGWVRKTRLARVRQQLMTADEDASVTQIANSYGFAELGRFAAHYRKEFCELPSDTLKAARSRSPIGEIDDEALRLSWTALSSAYMVGLSANRAALDAAARAQELAPNLALPKAVSAWCLGQRAAHGFSTTQDRDRAAALTLSDEAVRMAGQDALALSVCSGALTLLRRLNEADRLIERALAIEPWSPWAWLRRAWLSAYRGDHDGAIRELQMTLQLMPIEPLRHIAFIGIGCAHFNAGRYERAARWVQSGTESVPDSFWADRVRVAALVHAGAHAEARRLARVLLRKDRNLTVHSAQNAWPFPQAFMNRLGEGLQRAGVPRS